MPSCYAHARIHLHFLKMNLLGARFRTRTRHQLQEKTVRQRCAIRHEILREGGYPRCAGARSDILKEPCPPTSPITSAIQVCFISSHVQNCYNIACIARNLFSEHVLF